MEQIKILIVDDESRMRKLIRDFLEREGYQILEAADGVEAMDLFYSDKTIDLVILDVMMPRMDGWQVCKEIREHSKLPIVVPILLMSTFSFILGNFSSIISAIAFASSKHAECER